MLFKFSTTDLLSTALVDVATGHRAYNIDTVLLSDSEDSGFTRLESPTPKLTTLSFSSTSSSFLSERSSRPLPPPDAERHRTTIADAAGRILAHITWTGRQPDITIGDEHVGDLTKLFGSSTVRFMPKILAVPTRFNTEYVWNATPTSLTLIDYDTEQVKGMFHQDVLRIPSSLKQKASLPSLKRSKSFVRTHVSGVGQNYLEFEPTPLVEPVEIIISFIMMEILRRGRFDLTPYEFRRPKFWRLQEARDLVLKQLRRGTI
ncbi:hypothetical protein BDN72DRAFT_891287 [Pluteus cervinus]|uniref:Uncharacterized protein n=1 Tax=Pluteus cervinus TaxID=181527 RepID=A0ACD3BE22_9AGAR|nr:hypothetical protein BDN72DRAFT_891287 [Pluteus cervinus]